MNDVSGFIATSDSLSTGRVGGPSTAKPLGSQRRLRKEMSSARFSVFDDCLRQRRRPRSLGFFAAKQTRHLRLERIEVGKGIVDIG